MQNVITYCMAGLILAAILSSLNQTTPGVSAGPTTMLPVSARLVTDASAIESGRSFNVGVLFKIDPGWHIYWKNPGDAGLATSVKFILPEGFVVGKLRWPTPQMFRQSGDIVGYGYSGSVLLYASVIPPAGLKEGSTVPIKAEVDWLGCEKVCLPGEAAVEMALSVAAKAKADNAELFSEWMAKTDPVAPMFALEDQNGKTVRLADYAGKIVVLEWMNADCPFVKYHYRPDVKTMICLAEQYKDKDVIWLAVNSTNYWTNQKAQIFHMEQQLPYPILDDHQGVVGRLFCP
ncbi:MAG: redoxin domain-containing protein [Planctomycetes bacterium]|nr:redoxin domain-containing protein [Planctomycetota bacterium]